MCIRHFGIYLAIQPLHILFCNIFLQCYRESYRLSYAYKNSQSYTRRKPRNLSAFCHNICGTLMCIPGIERYKYTHKRAPRSSRAIHCTQASRKQVSIQNVLRQECESFFLECQPRVFVYSWTKHASHNTWGTLCLIVKFPWLDSILVKMCVHGENTSEPPRIDDRHQRSLSPPFSPPLPNSLLKHRRLFGFIREMMKTNYVRSNDI